MLATKFNICRVIGGDDILYGRTREALDKTVVYFKNVNSNCSPGEDIFGFFIPYILI